MELSTLLVALSVVGLSINALFLNKEIDRLKERIKLLEDSFAVERVSLNRKKSTIPMWKENKVN